MKAGEASFREQQKKLSTDVKSTGLFTKSRLANSFHRTYRGHEHTSRGRTYRTKREAWIIAAESHFYRMVPSTMGVFGH